MNWTTEIPKEPGMYWFFGDEYAGARGVDYTDKYVWEPRLCLVNICKTSNSLMGVTNGNFIQLRKFRKDQHSEGVLGYWSPAELPKPPEDTEGYGK